MADPAPASIDLHRDPEPRTILEERFWRPIVDGSTLEALRDDHALGAADDHPALFADHGIVHVRDIAAGVVELADTAEGMLLPRRPPDRHAFMVGLAVLITYVHDVGMYDPTPTGRRLHALHGAHLPFSGQMDDVLERLGAEAGPVVRRVAAVDAAAPSGPRADVVLRELVSLAVAHSKSTVPPELLADTAALRSLMRHIVLTDLDRHRLAETVPAHDDAPAEERGANARWYADPEREPYAWLDSGEAAHRALAEDAIDAVRLVRAADALRQRGTTLRTSAGNEIFIDADSGAAVLALRTRGERPPVPAARGESGELGGGEPAARVRDPARQPPDRLPPRGASARPRRPRRRARRRRPRWPTSAPTCSARSPSAARRPTSGRRRARRARCASSSSARRTSRASPTRSPRRWRACDPSLAPRVAIVADLEEAAQAERDRYLRADAVPAGGAAAAGLLVALGKRGMKVAAIEPGRAFEDVRRVGLAAGEVLVEAGTSPAFVYVALAPGLRAQPLGGYEQEDVPAWLPIGITGVVRRAERNSTVVAVTRRSRC